MQPTVVELDAARKGHLRFPEARPDAERKHGAQVEEKRGGPVEFPGTQDRAVGCVEQRTGEGGAEGVFPLDDERLRAVLLDVCGCDAVHDHRQALGGHHEDAGTPVHTPHPIHHLIG